jgi:hypothetical protein
VQVRPPPQHQAAACFLPKQDARLALESHGEQRHLGSEAGERSWHGRWVLAFRLSSPYSRYPG